MRALVEGLGTPYPLSGLLPAILQEDDFTTRLTAALDDVLAPVVSAIDCLDSYIDPHLAPDDFVSWLASWIGAPAGESWPLERRRAAVAEAVALYRIRGTVEGLRAQVAVLTGGEVEVVDDGGVTWSPTPDAELPPTPAATVLVRVTGPDPDASDPAAIHELVGAVKPAHVVHRVEVHQPERTRPGSV